MEDIVLYPVNVRPSCAVPASERVINHAFIKLLCYTSHEKISQSLPPFCVPKNTEKNTIAIVLGRGGAIRRHSVDSKALLRHPIISCHYLVKHALIFGVVKGGTSFFSVDQGAGPEFFEGQSASPLRRSLSLYCPITFSYINIFFSPSGHSQLI